MSEERDIMQEILDDNGLGSIAFQGPRTPVGPFSDEWPHNRSREAWDRARAERWPDPSWSSLRKVERWQEMRREGLMGRPPGYVPALFMCPKYNRLRRGTLMLRYGYDGLDTPEDRTLGEYSPRLRAATLERHLEACGVAEEEEWPHRIRCKRGLLKWNRIQFVVSGGLIGWFKCLNWMAKEYAEDPTPTTETAPLYRDDTLGTRPVCEVKR